MAQLMTGVDYETLIKQTLTLTPTERIDGIFDLLTNIAVLSHTIWGTPQLKQEALEEIGRLVRKAQCLC